MRRPPLLSVVVPARDQHELLAATLASALRALAASPGEWELIVVDDASGGDPRGAVPAAARLLVNTHRLGFGPSANRGVESARGEFCCLLNSDMAVDIDFFADYPAFFERPNVLGVCGTIEEPDGTDAGLKELRMGDFGPFFRFGRVHEQTGRRPVPYANGGGSFFRRNLFLKLGGFDDLFAPYYWEDADLGFRAWKQGLESHYCPSLHLRHQRGASTGQDGISRMRRIKQRNRHLFHWLNFTDVGLGRLLHRYLLPEAVSFLRRGRVRRLAWLLGDCRLLTRVARMRGIRRAQGGHSAGEVLQLCQEVSR